MKLDEYEAQEYMPHHIYLNKNGYKMLKTPFFTRSIHRLIVESFYRQSLTSIEHIHHIDGNKQNNNLDNLELLYDKDHGYITAEKNKTMDN